MYSFLLGDSKWVGWLRRCAYFRGKPTHLKGRVHWFSMLFVMNKCFLLNLKKIWR